MESNLNNTLLFLVKTIFDLYLMVLIVRFILQYLRTSFLNPVAQFSYKLSEPMLAPFRGVIPRTQLFDLPLGLFILLMVWAKLILVSMLQGGAVPSFFILFFIGLATIVQLTVNLYFYCILGVVILSWVAPNTHSPLTVLLHQLTDPILMPARRMIPDIGGIDLSPIIVIIGLKALDIFLIGMLTRIAYG